MSITEKDAEKYSKIAEEMVAESLIRESKEIAAAAAKLGVQHITLPVASLGLKIEGLPSFSSETSSNHNTPAVAEVQISSALASRIKQMQKLKTPESDANEEVKAPSTKTGL